jgi:hypothetical protein
VVGDSYICSCTPTNELALQELHNRVLGQTTMQSDHQTQSHIAACAPIQRMANATANINTWTQTGLVSNQTTVCRSQPLTLIRCAGSGVSGSNCSLEHLASEKAPFALGKKCHRTGPRIIHQGNSYAAIPFPSLEMRSGLPISRYKLFCVGSDWVG